MENSKCIHTVGGSEKGEIVSAVTVPDEKQIHCSHQVEQFSLQPNMNPKIHVSDTCPAGIQLWQKLFQNVNHQNAQQRAHRLQDCSWLSARMRPFACPRDAPVTFRSSWHGRNSKIQLGNFPSIENCRNVTATTSANDNRFS